MNGITHRIRCPNCGNMVELTKGIVYGEDFGFCENPKCKHLILISNGKITHFDPRSDPYINYLLRKGEGK
jgi:hypothetical protein